MLALCDNCPCRARLPDWRGATVAVLGTGPSLRTAPLDRLRETGVKVVAIHSAWRRAPWADWIFAGGSEWWFDNREAVACGGLKTYLAGTHTPPGPDGVKPLFVSLTMTGGGPAFDPEGEFIVGGCNAGFSALHALIKTGTRRIILLGIDGQTDGEGRSHWVDDPAEITQVRPFWRCDDGERYYPALLPVLAERGIEVLNCSPGTMVQSFPTSRLEDVLRL